MQAIAKIKNVPIAPRKARLVADLIRGKSVINALDQLTFTHKAASPIIEKLLRSAVANATYQDSSIDETDLFVTKIIVNCGITRKWIRPRSRGIANRILRRKCHIELAVGIDDEDDNE